MLRVVVCLLSALSIAGCNGGGTSGSPTGPSAATTRVINLSGNLAFGEVMVGSFRDLSFTITNSGNATLTITGMTVTGELADYLTASFTSGTIAPGGSQTVTVRLSPTTPGAFSGNITVNGDQTSGGNTIAVSATATSAVGGTWRGQYVVERCDGAGSLQDLLCGARRGLFPIGTPLPIRIALNQSGTNVNGTVSFGQVTGPVSGVVTPDGTLTLQGTTTSGTVTLQISQWSTRIQGNSMVGNVSYNATVAGVPGVAVLVTRLSGVVRQ